jgi:hypothetical protein
MPRFRQIYQGDLLYIGPTGATSATGALYSGPNVGYGTGSTLQAAGASNLVGELFRVQSASFNASKTLTDVNQYGELAAIDRIPLEPPTVSLSFQYLLANLVNEKRLGFTISSGSQVSAISGILNTSTDVKNYFIATVPEGNDVVGLNNSVNSSTFVTAIGNGFITNYTTEGAVGGFPTSSVTVEALNLEMHGSASGSRTPAVNPDDGTSLTGWFYQLPSGTQNVNSQAINSSNSSLSVLRPGDISLTLGLGVGDGFVSESDMKIQSYSISYDLGRDDLQKLGSKYAFAKVIRFPVNATMSVTADIGDFQTGSLVEIVNNNTSFNPKVTLKSPGSTTNVIAEFQLKGAKMDNQDFSSSIGANKSVTMTFTTQIAGPQSPNGVFMSGAN